MLTITIQSIDKFSRLFNHNNKKLVSNEYIENFDIFISIFIDILMVIKSSSRIRIHLLLLLFFNIKYTILLFPFDQKPLSFLILTNWASANWSSCDSNKIVIQAKLWFKQNCDSSFCQSTQWETATNWL